VAAAEPATQPAAQQTAESALPEDQWAAAMPTTAPSTQPVAEGPNGNDPMLEEDATQTTATVTTVTELPTEDVPGAAASVDANK